MTDGLPLQNLLLERDGAVAVVTVNRPQVLNALNFATLEELHRTVAALGEDQTVRCVVLTGAGEKSFVAGADINELAVQSPVTGREHAQAGQQVFDAIENLGTPVIAAINGYALGGGCELAMACTIRIAADTAMLGQPEINLGLIPGYGGTQRLARLVGTGRALELLLTGDRVSAAEALSPRPGEPRGAGRRADAGRAEAGRDARRQGADRGALHPRGGQPGREPAVRRGAVLEATLFGLVASTDDMREGTQAFLEKRKPAFKGT